MQEQHVDVLRIVAGLKEIDLGASEHSAQLLYLERHIARLASGVAGVLHEVGCSCIAERISIARPQPPPADEDGCPACAAPQECSSLTMMVKLAPLTRALAQSGYYDYALRCLELAMLLEPTWDLNLAKAYLLMTLGDTGDACRIYKLAIQRWGSIPAGELQRLAGLAETHCGEEDIKEVLEQLRNISAN